MSASPTNIWRVPAYLPYLQPSLTDEAILEAEKSIGHRLPESYLALLKVQNGGYIRHRLPASRHSVIRGIGPHFPSLTGFSWEDSQEYVSFELGGLVPFDGGGHWFLCLDCRGGRTIPAVTHADTECDEERLVAASFDEYLGLLEIKSESDEDTLVITGVADVEAMMRLLGERMGVEIEPPDYWSHGYATIRGRGGNAQSPEWIWASPNLVRRGFVRDDDRRYEELKDLLPGEAPRHPQLPAESHLLTATEGLREKMLRACADLGLEVRPMTDY